MPISQSWCGSFWVRALINTHHSPSPPLWPSHPILLSHTAVSTHMLLSQSHTTGLYRHTPSFKPPQGPWLSCPCHPASLPHAPTAGQPAVCNSTSALTWARGFNMWLSPKNWGKSTREKQDLLRGNEHSIHLSS